MGKRVISFLLTLTMLFSMVGVESYAYDGLLEEENTYEELDSLLPGEHEESEDFSVLEENSSEEDADGWVLMEDGGEDDVPAEAPEDTEDGVVYAISEPVEEEIPLTGDDEFVSIDDEVSDGEEDLSAADPGKTDPDAKKTGEDEDSSALVHVRLVCVPADSTLSVFDSTGAEIFPTPDGDYLLAPGVYRYLAQCNGFDERRGSFTVSEEETDMTVYVRFEPETENLLDQLPDNVRVLDVETTEYGADFREYTMAEYRSLMAEEEAWLYIDAQDSDLNTPIDFSKFPTPKNVSWSEDYCGVLNFKLPESVDLSSAYVLCTVYKNGSTWFVVRWMFNYVVEANETLQIDLRPQFDTNGTYTARLQLTPRNGNVEASDVSSLSNSLDLNLGTKLGTPRNPRWENKKACWDAVSDAAGYWVSWTSQYGSISGSWFYGYPPSTYMSVPLQNSGTTTFRVRALADLYYRANGDYSKTSAPENIRGGYLSKSGHYGYYDSSFREKQTASLPYYYNDEWFDRSSMVYNHELATMSLNMAIAAYGSEPPDRGSNIRNLLYDMGFSYTKQSISYPTPTEDSIGYAIGSKKITGEEEPYTLIAVAVRGGGYEAEWSSNFRLGLSSSHEGFDKAKSDVYNGLISYIRSQRITGKIKIWVTGYSRAAATSNLLGQRLDSEALHGTIPGLSQDGIFVYCFECPRGINVDAPMFNGVDYNNIFNIVNYADVVTKVAMEDWGYQRFGTTYYLPSPELMSSKKYNAYAKNMRAEYKKILSDMAADTGSVEEAVKQISAQGAFTDKVASTFCSYFESRSLYAIGYEDTVRSIVYMCMGHGDFRPWTIVEAIVEGLPAFAILHPIICGRLLLNGETVKHGHYPELCLAWMNAISAGNASFVGYENRKAVLNCPVDVFVYDSCGDVVAEIINDEVQDLGEDALGAFVDENGQKIVILPRDEEYRIETRATDEGTVSCQITEQNVDAGSTSRVVNYFDVEIQKDDVLALTAENTETAYASYIMTDNDGNTVDKDMDISGEIPQYSASAVSQGPGMVYGGGTYLVGEFCKFTAVPNDGAMLLGWYDEQGNLLSREEEFRMRIEFDRSITARFVSRNIKISLDREYLALENGSAEQPLAVSIEPAELTEFLSWSVENTDNSSPVITVKDASPAAAGGIVSPVGPGTAYAVATVRFKDLAASARCRIDVTNQAVSRASDGIQLGQKTAELNLFSTDYSQIEVLLLLRQNFSNIQSANNQPLQDNGVSIRAASFTDPAAARCFSLRVMDDRRLAIVPTAEAIDNPDTVTEKYSSAIRVEIEGAEQPFVSDTELLVSVSKNLPKLKADTLSFNSFYTEERHEISVTGATPVSFSADALPEWLQLEEGALILGEGAPQKSSSVSVPLLVETEEWAVRLPVSIPVKLNYLAPKLKLSASSVTLNPDADSSDGFPLSLLPSAKDVIIADMEIDDLQVTGAYEIRDFSAALGSFTLKPTADPVKEKLTLTVSFRNSRNVVRLPLNVNVKTVTLKPEKTTLTLNPYTYQTVEIPISAAPAEYVLTDPILHISDASNRVYYDGLMDLEYSPIDRKLRITPTYDIAYFQGETFKIWIGAEGVKEASITVKILKEAQASITMDAKVSGSITPGIAGGKITVTPSFKNYVPNGREAYGYAIYVRSGGEDIIIDTQEYFDVTLDPNNNVVITAKKELALDKKLSEAQYSIVLDCDLGYNIHPTTKQIKLPIKRGTFALKVSQSKVTLNTQIGETLAIPVNSAVKGFTVEDVLVRIKNSGGIDEQIISDSCRFHDGVLNINFPADEAFCGKSIQLELLPAYMGTAYANSKATVLTVNFAPRSARPTITVKLSGKIDVLRSGSAVTVVPGYKNLSGNTEMVQRIEVLRSADGKTFNEDVTDHFSVRELDDGKLLVSCAQNAELDHTSKYKLRLVAEFSTGLQSESPLVNLPIGMGAAKLSLSSGNLKLYRNDRYSRADLRFLSDDPALNKVREVQFKNAELDALYEIVPYGDGSFAIGFRDQQISPACADTSIVLNLWITGNVTEKPNASITVKLSLN